MKEMKMHIGTFKSRLKHAYQRGAIFIKKLVPKRIAYGVNRFKEKKHNYLVLLPKELQCLIRKEYLCTSIEPNKFVCRDYYGRLDWKYGDWEKSVNKLLKNNVWG